MELQHAIATSQQSDDLTEEAMILDCCLGLVKIDIKTFIVKFSHMSIHDFLASKRHIFFPKAEVTLFRHCLGHIKIVAKKKEAKSVQFDPRVNSFFSPFLRYAAQFWGDHAAAGFDETVEREALSLLKDKTALWIWTAIYYQFHAYWFSFPIPQGGTAGKEFTLLHVAAMFGSHSSVKAN